MPPSPTAQDVVLVPESPDAARLRVRINDRGPATAARLLDLSYAAARQLDMVRAGVAWVKVEFLVPDRALPSS